MEIRVSTQTLKAVEKAVSNKYLSKDDLDKIEKTLAADKVLSPDEKLLLDAIKDRKDITLTDGKQSSAISLTRVDLGFGDDLPAIQPGPVKLENKRLVADGPPTPPPAPPAPTLPTVVALKASLRQHPGQVIAELNKLWEQEGSRPELLRLIRKLPTDSQIVLAAAARQSALPDQITKTLVSDLSSTQDIKRMVQSNKNQNFEALAWVIEKSNDSRQRQLLESLFDQPRWGSKGQLEGKHSYFKPTLSHQLQLHDALMKSPNIELRSQMLKQSVELNHRLEIMRGYSEEDPTGMEVSRYDRAGGMGIYERAHRTHYKARLAEIEAGQKPPESIKDTIYPQAWEYARRAEELDDYFGAFPSDGLSKQFRKSLQGNIGQGLATDSVQLVDYLREHGDKFSHEDLSGLIGLMLNPPNPEAALGFYKVIEKTVADATNPALPAERRQSAAYALGKYMGAAAAVAERLPEPSRGMLFFAITIGLDALPGVGKITAYKQKFPKVPGGAKDYLLDKFDALVNGKERDAVRKARKAILDMLDGVQESMMRVDAKEKQHALESAYITGRDFYEQRQYRLGKSSD
ncbi:MAG: hypothetical protein CVV27_13415 [Candidatus Melainabacteria bacterium HGW-Melainabacteria-1]|nr:MAG: hypothetical protein CVV27_13415 [Candidatus Melainabacteria bacterium HGW-Melainabacteria-1]